MATTLYLATHEGLAICHHRDNEWQLGSRALDEIQLTSVIAHDGVILAGSRQGVQRSDDGGQTWREANNGLTIQYVRWLAYHPERPELVFAGTEPAAIFFSEDGAAVWKELPEVSALRDEHSWMLPYSPEAGCVRGYAFHGQRGYAAVEVGGVLRSEDYGRSWKLAPGSDGNPSFGEPPESFVFPDIHDITVHPSSPNLVFAATGGGLYASADGGETWDLLYDCYCRALWLDPNDPDHIIFGPADRVGAIGRIEETHDGGRSWQMASDGLEVPWPRTMPERLNQIGDEIFAVLADGRLLVSSVGTLKWSQILPEAGKVTGIASV